jgi:hypothetical protein
MLRAEGGVRDVSALLRTLPHPSSPDVVVANLQLIREVGARDRVIRMIDEVLDSDELLAEVAAQSYRHVNLFDKIVLVGNDEPTAYRLTFHLWLPPYSDSEVRQELIHEHRFDFWSTILTGTLRSQTFARDESGKPYRRYRYVPETIRTRQFGDFYEFSGEQPLLSLGVNEKRPGMAYHLSAPVIHRILPPSDSAVCTLVLRGPRLRPYSFVYNTVYPSTNTTLNNVMFTPARLADKLKALRAALQCEEAECPHSDAVQYA